MQFFVNNKAVGVEEFPINLIMKKELLKVDGAMFFDNGILSYKFQNLSPIKIDIRSQLEYHKKFFYKNSIHKDPLAKAIGLKKGKELPSVLDATGGFLGDSLLLLSLGITNLTVYEKHPVLANLIANALSLASVTMNFRAENVQECKDTFDVVYFDPMYEEYNKKTAPKKEMQILREIGTGEENNSELASKLLGVARERLVIKRSIKASYLLLSPNHSIKGKSTRFDIYLP